MRTRPVLVLSPKIYLRLSRPGSGLAVPQFQALHDTVTVERDGAAALPGTDHVAHVQRLRLAVTVVDHDVVKLNWRVDDANLQEAVAAGIAAD